MSVDLVYVEINIAKDGDTESKFKASKAPQAANLLHVEVFEH